MRPASDVRRRRPFFRRTLALVLALLPMGGSVATVAAAMTGPAQGACTDHVCSCLKKCPPKKAAARPGCHGGESEAPSGPLFQSAGCHHGVDSAGPVASTPHLLPSPVEVDAGFQLAGVAGRPPASMLAGHPQLDGKPPKARG